MTGTLGCRVLAFARGWRPDTAELRRVRGHLRGLGAELVIVTDVATWRCRPDDEIARIDDAGALAREHGVGGGDAVVVIDGDGIVRFTHRQPELAHETLVAALEAATDAMLARAPVMFTRRTWLATCVVTGFTAAVLGGCKQRERLPGKKPPTALVPAVATDVAITLEINNQSHQLLVEPRVSLLDALRERLMLTGTKKGCDMGQCGACTVLVDGKRVVSCLTLAIMAQGKPITTIEGLAAKGALHPLQAAFIAHDGMQCGFCTSGQIMSAVGLLQEGHARSDDDVREQMSGNICRCGAYPNIVDAIQQARGGKAT